MHQKTTCKGSCAANLGTCHHVSLYHLFISSGILIDMKAFMIFKGIQIVCPGQPAPTNSGAKMLRVEILHLKSTSKTLINIVHFLSHPFGTSAQALTGQISRFILLASSSCRHVAADSQRHSSRWLKTLNQSLYRIMRIPYIYVYIYVSTFLHIIMYVYTYIQQK